ncbi:hypothetical protein PIB30_037920 [Stylosanthes scabra]|uniref:PGG domain-containing protein n=1 Tax=Stylosanthes scabra TaxID=79078 RepID=A0ABU6SF56_9FABA|nr:hypothetical protein [Stylosanthes scabra]
MENLSSPSIQNPKTKSFKDTIISALRWKDTEEKGEWLKNMRGNLAMVATLITSITFHVGLNPPGGIAPVLANGYVMCPQNRTAMACPGESVFAVAWREEYLLFMVFNTISFFSSLIMCLSLISGFPLNHRVPTCLLAIGMCISLTALALTYCFGAFMITPDGFTSYLLANKTFKVWSYFVGIAGFLFILRFVILCVQFFEPTEYSKSQLTIRT